jgi:hypothetical protein
MGSGEVILWLVGLATVFVLAGALWAAVRRAAARRSRRARRRAYRQAEHERRTQRRVTQPAALSPGISRERAAAVRRDAEKWALEVAKGRAAEPRNPHPQGSQEFVLWVTSYHLRLTELSEQDMGDAQASTSRP